MLVSVKSCITCLDKVLMWYMIWINLFYFKKYVHVARTCCLIGSREKKKKIIFYSLDLHSFHS